MKKFFSVFFIISILSYSVGGDTENLAIASSNLADCCELPGDGNDDAIVDFYDFMFILGWSYGRNQPTGDVDYPGPSKESPANDYCCDQSTSHQSCKTGLLAIDGYTQVSNHLMGTVDPACGTSHY